MIAPCVFVATRTQPIWGVTVHGSGEDWLVLWSETDSGGLIHYIGEDLK